MALVTHRGANASTPRVMSIASGQGMFYAMPIPRDTRSAEFGIETSLPAADLIKITNLSKIWGLPCWPDNLFCVAWPCCCLPGVAVNRATPDGVHAPGGMDKTSAVCLARWVSGAEPMEMAYACVPMYTGYAHGECCSADDLHKQQNVKTRKIRMTVLFPVLPKKYAAAESPSDNQCRHLSTASAQHCPH